MKKLSVLPIALAGLGIFAMPSPAQAVVEFDQNVTPDVIFGSGNANGSFTTDRSNGIELGLRGKLRHNALGQAENTFNSNGDGTYSFEAGVAPLQSFPTAEWSFEWSVNSNMLDPVTVNLDGLTYVLGLDSDPGPGTSFTTFDPISAPYVGQDHQMGNNSTPNGGGTPKAVDGAEYLALLAANNVAQNSWKPHWFIPGFDPTVSGDYAIYLEAYDGANLLARTEIQILAVGPDFAEVAGGIDNGGFELPDRGNCGFVGINSGLTGWTIGGTVDHICQYWSAAEGDQSLDMSGGNSGSVTQNLGALDEGHPYRVTFQMAGNSDAGNIVKQLNVDVGGAPETYTFDVTGTSRANMGWVEKTFEFIAGAGDVNLTFASLEPNAWGPALDDVKLFRGNSAPIATDDSYTVLEDGSLVGNAITNTDPNGADSDADGDAMTISFNTGTSNDDGNFSIDPDGAFSYDPADDFCGEDSFTYRVTDGDVESNLATVSITVTCVDDSPVAVDDTATVTEDDPATPIDVLANDTDVDDGPIAIDSVTQPANGVVVNNVASVTYQPNANYCNDDGPTDDFTYTLTPGGSTATVAVTVICVDDPPVAVDDTATLTEDDPATPIDVLANDTDVDGGPIAIDSVTQPANGEVVNNGANLTYQPNADYCNNGNAGVSTDDFTYTLTPGGSTATVAVTVTCVNDAPVANDDAYDATEDTLLSIVAAAGVLSNDTDVDGDVLSVLAGSVNGPSHGDLNVGSDGSFTYQGNLNYCGRDSFSYKATDDAPIDGDALDSGDPAATVSITVACVNDPPTVTSVVPGAQTSDYSDLIGTVVITVNDVDNVSTSLLETNEPPLSEAGLLLVSTGCDVIDTESPEEDGSNCTWSYDGKVLDPGDNVYDILFTASDNDGKGSVTGTHTLTIQPEDATVQLFDDNPVSQQVDEPDGVATNVVLMFEAWETNSSGEPQLDADDYPHDGTAADGDFSLAQGYMTLTPVGPGGPQTIECTPAFDGADYGEITTFTCTFAEVEVNTYEVSAFVSNDSDTATYYTGLDEDAFVVYDPSLGFTTGGGWFYWPDSSIPTCLEYNSEEPFDCLEPNEDPCAGYLGDKTNFGYTMKYNRKATSIQGSALLQRHTIDPVTCFDAGSYRVKSNALYGLSIGDDGGNPPAMGWAAFAGKSTYREPNGENEGNHLFFIYAEDHGEQGCNQDPSDRIWIEVWDKDDLTVMQVNGPDADVDAENIQCGNIYVPHETGGKGGGKK